MKPCKDDGEQYDITTYGDLGIGVRRWVCGSCSAEYTEPTAEAEDARRREAEAMFADHPDLMSATDCYRSCSMKKIHTLFVRDFTARPAYVTPEVAPGCEWVLAGEGEATRKYDGACMMLDQSGEWWARREVKAGKTPPPHYVPISFDDETGKTVGWEPVAQSAFAKWHAEAVTNVGPDKPGTYELLGPKINGNPDDYDAHILMPHGWALLSIRQDFSTAPRDYDGLRDWLQARPYEGIVWHHSDGRRAKLKAKDFPRQEIL